ncbi:hypothetical protein G6F42_020794 [Rhizopus arrhizus]|nr:hypothetical protein G6F42_020794 [Rhizopus arrhizus]
MLLTRNAFFKVAKTSLSIRSYSLASQKVAMSNFEKDKYINYQRIEDNLQIVRKRLVAIPWAVTHFTRMLTYQQIKSSIDLI